MLSNLILFSTCISFKLIFYSSSEIVTQILQQDGIAGLFKGWWGQVVALGCSNFVYFYAYNLLKVMIQVRTKRKINPIMNLSVGAVAGVINVLATTPLWMVSTQLAVQAKNKAGPRSSKPYLGMVDGLTRCYQSEGVTGLWKGEYLSEGAAREWSTFS